MSEKRSFRRYLRQLLLLDEPPERTARTFGFGVFIAFSPFIGLHTLIAIVILLFVKLNRLSFLAGVFSNILSTTTCFRRRKTGSCEAEATKEPN